MGRSTTETSHGAQITVRFCTVRFCLMSWAGSVKYSEPKGVLGLLPTYYYVPWYIPWYIPWESAQPSGSASEA
jgi:hypothetical protein